jgi:hypothetical protein
MAEKREEAIPPSPPLQALQAGIPVLGASVPWRSGVQQEAVPESSRCGCWGKDAWHRKYGMKPGEVCVNS